MYQNLKKELTDDEVKALVVRLLDRDYEAINETIEGLMQLAMRVVTRFVLKNQHRGDDLMQEAMLGLANGVWAIYSQAISEDHPNPKGFIVYNILQKIHNNFIEGDPIVRIPHESKRHSVLANPEFCQMEDGILACFDPTITLTPLEGLVDLLDLSPMEKEILTMKLDGVSTYQISLNLGVTQRRIQQLMKVIQGKYLDTCLEKPRKSAR